MSCSCHKETTVSDGISKRMNDGSFIAELWRYENSSEFLQILRALSHSEWIIVKIVKRLSIHIIPRAERSICSLSSAASPFHQN